MVKMQKVIAFKNPNNVCYANSVLQLLWNTNFMKEIDLHKTIIDNETFTTIDKKQTVGLELLKCLLLARDRFYNSDSDVYLCEFNLIKFRNIVLTEFWNNRIGQQDAHEFLNNLIDHIQNILEYFDLKIVQKYFSAKLISCIQGKCGHTSLKKINYDYYELFIKPNKNNDKLQTLIDNDFKNYITLTDDSAWECEECNTKVTAIKSPALIYKPPKILMICIQRFGFDRYGTKIRTTVDVDNEINITLMDDNDTVITYELCGFVTHLGLTLVAGHYIAVIKQDDKWLVCNDTIIYVKNTFEEAKKSSGGDIYLLMYKIKE